MLHAMAVAHARSVFDDLILITDTPGARIFQDFPYDAIYTEMDTPFVPPEAEHVWSAGKALAFKFAAEKLRRPFCHFDSDVFIRKPLDVFGADLFAQSDERFVNPPIDPWEKTPAPYTLIGIYLKSGCENLPYLPGHVRFSLTRRDQNPYNVGIVGGNNFELLGEWGRQTLQTINHRLNLKHWSEIYHSCAACFTEQYFFGSLARHRGVHVSTLFSDASRGNEQLMKEIGYTHLIGDTKHEFVIAQRVEVIMRERHTYLYEVVKGMNLPHYTGHASEGYYYPNLFHPSR